MMKYIKRLFSEVQVTKTVLPVDIAPIPHKKPLKSFEDLLLLSEQKVDIIDRQRISGRYRQYNFVDISADKGAFWKMYVYSRKTGIGGNSDFILIGGYEFQIKAERVEVDFGVMAYEVVIDGWFNFKREDKRLVKND